MHRNLNYIRLNDENNTRLNLNQVLGYTVDDDNSAITFNVLVQAGDSGGLTPFVISYVGMLSGLQMRLDTETIDRLTGSIQNSPPKASTTI